MLNLNNIRGNIAKNPKMSNGECKKPIIKSSYSDVVLLHRKFVAPDMLKGGECEEEIFTYRMQMLAVNPGQLKYIFNTAIRQDLERVVKQEMVLPPSHSWRRNTWNTKHKHPLWIFDLDRLELRRGWPVASRFFTQPDEVGGARVCRELFICNSISFGSLPPLDMHVKFIVEPSWYGPTVLSVTAAPMSSKMVIWVGGTVVAIDKGRDRWEVKGVSHPLARTQSILMKSCHLSYGCWIEWTNLVQLNLSLNS